MTKAGSKKSLLLAPNPNQIVIRHHTLKSILDHCFLSSVIDNLFHDRSEVDFNYLKFFLIKFD